MNIFVTNTDPQIAAMEHCDRHCVKQILECAQMLSTAQRFYGNDNPVLYKATHINHPCSVWTRQCKENYDWLYALYKGLCEVFHATRGKAHATDTKLSQPLCEAPRGIPINGAGHVLGFVTAMPEEYSKESRDVTQMYQHYLNDKFREWQSRAKPLAVTFPVAKPSWAVVG